MYADTINNSLTMLSVWQTYVGTPIKKGFASCVFHNDKTPSLKLYKHSWYCFSCGQGGDVVRFVEAYFNLEFKDAIARLDSDFSLGLLKKPTLSQKRKMDEELKKRKIEQLNLQKKKEYSQFAYNRLCEYHRWLIRQPPTKDIIHDTEFMERLLDKFLDPENLIEFDVVALLNALKTKFCDMGEVDSFARDC